MILPPLIGRKYLSWAGASFVALPGAGLLVPTGKLKKGEYLRLNGKKTFTYPFKTVLCVDVLYLRVSARNPK